MTRRLRQLAAELARFRATDGEVAAQLALQTLAAQFQLVGKPALGDPLRFLHDAVVAAHHYVLRDGPTRSRLSPTCSRSARS